jgi:hypothetical protein
MTRTARHRLRYLLDACFERELSPDEVRELNRLRAAEWAQANLYARPRLLPPRRPLGETVAWVAGVVGLLAAGVLAALLGG